MQLSIPQDTRLEIKFAAYEIELPTLLCWLKTHPAIFKTAYPDRWVNNIYFDTHNYAAYVQNLSGESGRIKLRYRWYGQTREPSAGTLEVKCKRNYFGWKLHFRCPQMHVGKTDDWLTIKQVLNKQLSQAGRLWLETYNTPILINRYYRRYFISADHKIRVTVDNQQSVWDQRYKPKPNYTQQANLPLSLVVEVKFDREDRDLASELIQGIPIRVSRHSKYMNGVNAISAV